MTNVSSDLSTTRELRLLAKCALVVNLPIKLVLLPAALAQLVLPRGTPTAPPVPNVLRGLFRMPNSKNIASLVKRATFKELQTKLNAPDVRLEHIPLLKRQPSVHFARLASMATPQV